MNKPVIRIRSDLLPEVTRYAQEFAISVSELANAAILDGLPLAASRIRETRKAKAQSGFHCCCCCPHPHKGRGK